MAKVDTGASGIVFNYVSGNQAPTVVWNLVNWLTTNAMATVQSYGTGTAGVYSATGAGFSLASLNTNLGAWVRIRMAEAREREYVLNCLNNGSGRSNNLTVMYSANAKFTGGAPSATALPTATDQGAVCTNLANAFGDAASLRINMAGYTTAVNGVLPWYLYCNTLGTSTLNGWLMHDALTSDGFDGTDPDPCAQGAGNIWGGSTLRFWTGYGTGSPIYQTMTAPSTQGQFNGAKAVDPTSGKDIAGRLEYGVTTYWKGYSYGALIKGQARGYPNNGNKSTDARTYIGGNVAGVIFPSANGVDLVL